MGYDVAAVRAKILVDPAGCWRWQAALDRAGYGRVRWGNRTVAAHRLVYELLRGEIPAGLELDHLCRVRSCVNPAHLEAVTHAENMRRSDAAVVAKQMAQRWASPDRVCPQGHPMIGDNVYVYITSWNATNRQCRQCRRDSKRRRRAAGAKD